MRVTAQRIRPVGVYVLVVLVGASAFLYPFWLPGHALPSTAHAGDAPLVAAAVGLLVVAAVTLELRRGSMNGATVAVLGVLCAVAGLLRLVDLPGGGSGIFFLVVLAGAAFGARFGMLLGLCAMATSAVLTGGVGPWLPFQMLGLGWMGAMAGLVGWATRRLPAPVEVGMLAVLGWAWGFAYGGIMNLWFWPFSVGQGPLSWEPGLSVADTVQRYWAFYVATSMAWDAAAALTNGVLIVLTGRQLLTSMRRVAARLDPFVQLEDDDRRAPSGGSAGPGRAGGALTIEGASAG